MIKSPRPIKPKESHNTDQVSVSPLPKSTNSKIKQKPKIIEMRALEQKFQFPVPPSKIVKENFASKIELEENINHSESGKTGVLKQQFQLFLPT